MQAILHLIKLMHFLCFILQKQKKTMRLALLWQWQNVEKLRALRQQVRWGNWCSNIDLANQTNNNWKLTALALSLNARGGGTDRGGKMAGACEPVELKALAGYRDRAMLLSPVECADACVCHSHGDLVFGEDELPAVRACAK